MAYANSFLEIDLNRFANEYSPSYKMLTDKVIAKGMVKYLRLYFKYDGKWDSINTISDKGLAGFASTAGIPPRRFYEIFREIGDERVNTFLSYFKEFNVEAIYKHGYLSLIDLEHKAIKK